MAKLFETDEKDLRTIWLADKVLDVVGNDEDEIKSDAITYAQNIINGS